MYKKPRTSLIWFIVITLAILSGIILFPTYYELTKDGGILFGCAMEDLLHLYCPVCGGTRALRCLFSFDIIGALRYNMFVVYMVVFAAAYYLKIFFSFILKKEKPFSLPVYVAVSPLVIMFLFFIIRNILLAVYKIDYIGDLIYFWS